MNLSGAGFYCPYYKYMNKETSSLLLKPICVQFFSGMEGHRTGKVVTVNPNKLKTVRVRYRVKKDQVWNNTVENPG